MDERDRPTTSRKRHRTDDISGSSFRLPHSSGITAPNSSRMRTAGNTQQQDNDANLPVPSEAQTPALEPLHPPIPSIPNFSAISQGITRPTSMPSSTADPPTGFNYSIALPLPNPGRAHRFCQACDHVNHVRRKLCTNCGAPKPSAVRNAVGVRSISEVDSAQDKRSQGDGVFKSDNYSQSQLPSTSLPSGAQFDIQNRINSQSLTQSDPRYPRQTEPVSYQARSLAMKSPGDDIPLLGTTQRPPQSSFPIPETHPSRRLRGGQAVLVEPLVTFNPLAGQENRYQPSVPRHPYGSPVDFQQKLFTSNSVDRDHAALPSVQGMPPQRPYPSSNTNYRQSSRPPVLDNRGIRASTQLSDDALPEEVLALNRNAVAPFDPRQNSRRFPNAPGMRQYSSDQPQIYPGMPDATGLLYRQGQELFHQQAQFRQDERGGLISNDPGRGQKYGQSLPVPPTGDDRGFPSHHLDVQRGHAVSVLDEQQQHSTLRRGLEEDRARQLAMDGRVDPHNLRHLHKHDDHVNVNTAQFQDHNRSQDDGRLALDNILMQHKNTGHTD